MRLEQFRRRLEIRDPERIERRIHLAAGGQVLAELPLSVAGLMSTADVHTVGRQLQQLHAAAQTLGCPLPSPFAALSFLPLPVIPELRVTPRGLFDVGKQQFVLIQ